MAWADQDSLAYGRLRRVVDHYYNGDGASRSVIARVSPTIFPMLGGRTKLGRLLLDSDERTDSRVVVLSPEAWNSYFQSSEDVIGRTVILDGTGHTIIGVLAEGFDFPSRQTQFWVPFVERASGDGGQRFVNVLARLRDDVSLEEGTAEANVIGVSAQDEPPRSSQPTLKLRGIG